MADEHNLAGQKGISCAISSTMNRQKRTETAKMATVNKFLTKVYVAVLKIQRNSNGNQWRCLKIRRCR